MNLKKDTALIVENNMCYNAWVDSMMRGLNGKLS
jgi:hypothetical protein